MHRAQRRSVASSLDFVFDFNIILFTTKTISALCLFQRRVKLCLKGRLLQRVIWKHSSFICNCRDFILFFGAVFLGYWLELTCFLSPVEVDVKWEAPLEVELALDSCLTGTLHKVSLVEKVTTNIPTKEIQTFSERALFRHLQQIIFIPIWNKYFFFFLKDS